MFLLFSLSGHDQPDGGIYIFAQGCSQMGCIGTTGTMTEKR